jgi:hypothetical protein
MVDTALVNRRIRYAVERAIVRERESMAELLADCLQAFQHTRDYVQPKVTLYAQPGWSWYDMCERIAAVLGEDHEAVESYRRSL